MRLGVIDCGTNTFHLLIAEANGDGSLSTVHKERNYVRLGQEGLAFIGAGPFQRGILCIAAFQKTLLEHGVEKLQAFGTEALRRASNGQGFIAAVEVATGVRIQLITGDEEARLIHLGVMRATPPFEGKGLVMDIGGGSVEFIIADRNEVFWAQSFPVGVQVLYSQFHGSDPISEEDLMDMAAHLEAVLQPLLEVLETHKTPLLIGSSGSFEVIEEMLLMERPYPLYSIVPSEQFPSIYHNIIASTLAERYLMPKLPPERAELIVVAFALIDFVLKKAGIQQVMTSAYAMKEGILWEMVEGRDC